VRRRTFLAFATSTALGGCLSDPSGDYAPVDVDCPTLLEDADSLCAHTGDPELALRPSSWELADGANVSVKFALSNDADETARVADFPSLKRRADDGWEHVWPMLTPTLEKRLQAGSSYSWEFTFYKEGTEYDADEHVELYELEPATYAAVVGAELGDRPVQCVAPFEVGDGEEGT
jgi:hypothetical protein